MPNPTQNDKTMVIRFYRYKIMMILTEITILFVTKYILILGQKYKNKNQNGFIPIHSVKNHYVYQISYHFLSLLMLSNYHCEM